MGEKKGMSTIQETSFSIKVTYLIRNFFSRPLFRLLEGNLGRILDIGGGSFYKNLVNSSWSNYVVLEPDLNSLPKPNKLDKINSISADAGKSPIKNETFDTIIIIQVLQFIFEPIKVISEAHRILRKNGKLIIQVPQSGNLHGVPNHYYNFTRFWLERSLSDNKFKIVNYIPLGGAWRTIASRLFLMFWPVMGHPYYLDDKFKKRGILFWILFPIQLLVAILFFVVSLILSISDIKEEANNHLIVAVKI
jgi:SAM-dependent methyltransferase